MMLWVFKVVRDMFDYVVNRAKFELQEVLAGKIDLIMDYCEKVYALPKGLNEKILGELEAMILAAFDSLDKLAGEYEAFKPG